MIKRDFGNETNFHTTFYQAAKNHFGSGWCWLVYDRGTMQLRIITTQNAENPAGTSNIPLLCLDCWEHSWYLDYKYKKNKYIMNFMRQINWDFVNKQLENAITLTKGDKSC